MALLILLRGKEGFLGCGVIYPSYLYDETATANCKSGDLPGVTGGKCGWIIKKKLTMDSPARTAALLGTSAEEAGPSPFMEQNSDKSVTISQIRLSSDGSHYNHVFDKNGNRTHDGELHCGGLELQGNIKIKPTGSQTQVIPLSDDIAAYGTNALTFADAIWKVYHTPKTTANLNMQQFNITADSVTAKGSASAHNVTVDGPTSISSPWIPHVIIGDNIVHMNTWQSKHKQAGSGSLDVYNKYGGSSEIGVSPTNQTVTFEKGSITGVFDDPITDTNLTKLNRLNVEFSK